MVDIVKEALSVAQRLYSVGEVVGGSYKEEVLLNFSRAYLEEAVDEIKTESFPVLSWHEDYCVVEVNGEEHQCSLQPPFAGEVDIEFNSSSLRFIKVLDRVSELEMGEPSGGRIFVAEVPRDPDDMATIANGLMSLNPAALIFVDPRNALRRVVILNDVLPTCKEAKPVEFPVFTLRLDDFKEALKRGRARISAKARLFSSYAHNLVATINGSSDKRLLITAHYDHWLDGASDNVAGASLTLSMARAFGERGGPGRFSLTFVLFGAEEGFPENLTYFYWLVGSRHHVNVNYQKLTDEVALAVNLDVIYETPLTVFTSNPLLRGLLTKGAFNFEGFKHDNPIFDSFSFLLAGIPSLSISSFERALVKGVYHSSLDRLEAIEEGALREAFTIVSSIAQGLSELEGSVGALKDLEGGLSLEVIGDDVELRIRKRLYDLLIGLKGCAEEIKLREIWGWIGSLSRLLARAYVGGDFGIRLNVREAVKLVACHEDVVYIPTGLRQKPNECFIDHRFNLELLKYILSERCSY